MKIRFTDWVFEVDIAANMEYTCEEAKSHCLCKYCRNFYASVDSIYPQLRPFLSSFGIDIEAPEELLPKAPTVYDIAYRVVGEVVTCGFDEIPVSGLSVDIRVSPEESGFFWLCLDDVYFPWQIRDDPEPFVTKNGVPFS